MINNKNGNGNEYYKQSIIKKAFFHTSLAQDENGMEINHYQNYTIVIKYISEKSTRRLSDSSVI